MTPVKPAIVRAVERKIIDVPGVDDEQIVRAIRSSFWSSPSPSVRGLADAVTRAAHEHAWPSPWAQDGLQDQAGALIRDREQVARVMVGAINSARDQGWRPGAFSLASEADRLALAQQPIFCFDRNA